MDDAFHPVLARWRDVFEDLRWPALGIDDRGRLVWLSSEMIEFLNSSPEEIGLGSHILTAYGGEAWTSVRVNPYDEEFLTRMLGYARWNLESLGLPLDEVGGPFGQLLESIDPSPYPALDAGWMDYNDPRLSPETPSVRINFILVPLHTEQGQLAGAVVVSFPNVRANVLHLLGRGDQDMFERMARLVEPGRHHAAILFCDLAASTQLSRRLPNLAYFNLIRSLWTRIDEVIARHRGIVGKHAGDGASAYFLALDFDDSVEKAAAACLRAAREIHELSGEVFQEFLDQPCQMRVGAHWAAGLFMGQLVPGGRLEVTALGDEVNETARIESCAEPGQTLVSKHLAQQLGPDEAAELGIDLEKLRFNLLSELPAANPKAVEDAGGLPVVPIE